MDKIKLSRLQSLALRELSLYLQNDIKIEDFKKVSIMEVKITNDLSFMTIYYTVYKDLDLDKIKDLLETNKAKIRHYLASKIKARKMPELIFKYDNSLSYANHIEDLLKNIK